ncbi:MAG: hypothetical protein K8R46_09700 [Pirellulales bacterium]|nr:hypothetical protein [Pirellulales bacterium]
MGILDNRRQVRAGLSLVIALLLLVVAAVMLPRLRVQGEAPSPRAKKAPADVKEADLAKESDGWGLEREGLRTRLMPVQKEYVIGQPAKFRLEMKNFGEHARRYDSQGVAVHNTIRISDPDGKPVPYVAGMFQTGRRGDAPSIAPGKTVVLFDKRDLTNHYLFVKPGSYTLQFRAWKPFPPSNTITVKMRPGTLPMSMHVPARLMENLPKKWRMSLNWRVAEVIDGKITPPGWESGAGTYLSLVRYWNTGDGGLSVPVWVAERRLARTGTTGRTGEALKPGEAADYLGKGADGHVYWILPEKAETEWPDIRAKIKTALKIEE